MKFFFISIIFLTVNLVCESTLELKIFRKNLKWDEGFLFKKLKISNRSLPIIFKKYHYENLKFFCSELNYLDFHGLSYPKQLSLKQNFFIADCSISSCN